jgi:transposase
MVSDAQWALLEPLIEACRPKGKTPPQDLRRTLSAILWRHQNGAKWRAVPEELGPWWRAAQIFIRWARAGVWERLLSLVQERGVKLGMVFLDGTSVRAHQKAAGARRKGDLKLSERIVKPLAALVAAIAPRLVGSPTVLDGPSPSGSRPVRHMNSPMPSRCSSACRTCRAGSWPIAATPAMAFASTSGAWEPDPPSHRSGMRRRSLVRTGSTIIAMSSSGSGPG